MLFDRAGVVRPVSLDQAELAAILARAVAGIRERLPFTLPQVAKEIRRGDAVAALVSYHRYVLAPLVELSFVADLDDLAVKTARAGRLLRDLLDELGWRPRTGTAGCRSAPSPT